jgi:NAD(P)-dependent dehydrogenase (short-subunit alcohol dehydrogenase family)
MASRLVVITGGLSGIGAGCATRFREEGDDVVTLDISDPDHPVDVTDQLSVEQSFRRLPRPPDVLITAAGIGDGAPLLDLDISTWRRVLSVNVEGALLCMKAAATRMMTAGKGVIVNVTSINDRWPLRGAAAYCSSKAALTMLTRVASLELGPAGIRVVGVAPGIIDTPLVAEMLAKPPMAAAWTARSPLGQPAGRVADVADVVAFLASDHARWITGEIVVVDGGQLQYGLPDFLSVLSEGREGDGAASP